MTSDGVLAAADFAAFFKAAWGVAPFPWQQRLLDHLVDGGGKWPDVLNLPTGSGKTAALDIAVFHLALQSNRGSHRTAPLRIAFVVDRRLIVDDAHERARKLGDLLREAVARPEQAAPEILKVARALSTLAGRSAWPLLVRRLRGGAPLEEDWASTPVQPTILCSTVDQVGSRLLFRGYGLSDRMKPIHAGLLGSDCLLLLDEAHLAEPFRQTLSSVRRLRGADTSPFQTALLSATPGKHGGRFGLDAADLAHPVLAGRLMVSKPARLVEIVGKPGADPIRRRAEEYTGLTRSMLDRLAAQGLGAPVIGVVVNRVARARATFEMLRERLPEADVMLIIGPARAADRLGLSRTLEPIRTGQHEARGQLGKPLVLVATQTIEAGVDLDLDGLLTEAAPLDALRQRFGRLNRDGRPITAEATIVAFKEDVGAKTDDPIYGDRIAKTWQRLQELSTADGIVDFGIAALDARITDDDATALSAPMSNAPVLMPAYAHLWAQTAPVPRADPDVALFLHGPDRAPASVQVVWRADIMEADLRRRDAAHVRELLTSRLALMRPRATEAIEVPLWSVRAWLERADVTQERLSDVGERAPESSLEERRGRPAFRWAGEDSERTGVVQARHLRNGDLIVVPAAYGGCDAWGWSPASESPVIDVADLAQEPFWGHRFVVRVTAELVAQERRCEAEEGDEDSDPRIDEVLATRIPQALGQHEGERPTALLDGVRALDLPLSLKRRLAALDHSKARLQAVFPYGFDGENRPRGVVFVAPGGIADADAAEPVGSPATESDEIGAFAERAVSLIEHSGHVRQWAEHFSRMAGLAPALLADVALAAFLHDAGKADPRYQAYFAGGDPYGPDSDEVLAKSGQRRLPREAWTRSGLPDKWRHEALSVRLALLHPDLEQANDRQLVLWLIGTHHGFGRPLFPHDDPDDSRSRPGLLRAFGVEVDLPPGPGAQSLAFDDCGCDWSSLFEILKRRYGIWGLARLEAFVRLADHRASEQLRGAPLTTEILP